MFYNGEPNVHDGRESSNKKKLFLKWEMDISFQNNGFPLRRPYTYCQTLWCAQAHLCLKYFQFQVIRAYLEWDDDFLKALSVLALSALVDESENAVLETGKT